MTAPDPLRGLDPRRTSRRSGRRTAGFVTLAVLGGLGLLLALVGAAVSGLGGLLVGLGLTLLVLGLGGVLLRRRRHGAAVLGAGFLVLVLGVVLAPKSPPTTTAAEPTTATSVAPTTTASTAAAATSAAATTTAALTTDPTEQLIAEASSGTALAALASLEVKGRAPKTGYDRDLFGSGWLDVDRNGCDTRNDVLVRDLADLAIEVGTKGCVALSGVLHGPYTGRDIPFTRGSGTSSAVQVDHVVALSDAWQKGAQGWDETTREAFANDPLELLAVDGPTNQAKGAGDAATWLPPRTTFRCAYVARQVTVKAKYGLWMTEAERAATAGVLATCPDEPVTPDAVAAGNRVVRQQAQVTADEAAAGQAAAGQVTAAAQAAEEVAARQAAAAAQQAAQQQVAPPAAAPPSAPSGGTVTPGAFCSNEGAFGQSKQGKSYQCASRVGDRARWRPVG